MSYGLLNPFPMPMLWASWGTAPGGTGQQWHGSTGLRDVAVAGGYKSVAVQYGQVVQADVKTLRDAGLFVALWGQLGGGVAAAARDLAVQGLIPQVEGPGQYDGTLALVEAARAIGLRLPINVVTTFWGLYDPTNDATIRSGSRWKQLKQLGVTAAHVECYAADGFAAWEPHLKWGNVIGISDDELVPLFGAYRGEAPDSYGDTHAAGSNYGVYIAEEMSNDSIKTWGGMNRMTLPLYWQVIDLNTQRLLHEERATTWLDPTTKKQVTGLGQCLDWMDSNLSTLRTSGDVQLRRVAHT